MALGALVSASAAITAVFSGLRTWSAWILVLGSLASLALLVQVPLLAALVHLKPLHISDWALVAAAGVLAVLFALIVKIAMRRPARFLTG
jgi:ABC-type glycerol-3-phosphate transport system permease component